MHCLQIRAYDPTTGAARGTGAARDLADSPDVFARDCAPVETLYGARAICTYSLNISYTGYTDSFDEPITCPVSANCTCICQTIHYNHNCAIVKARMHLLHLMPSSH